MMARSLHERANLQFRAAHWRALSTTITAELLPSTAQSWMPSSAHRWHDGSGDGGGGHWQPPRKAAATVSGVLCNMPPIPAILDSLIVCTSMATPTEREKRVAIHGRPPINTQVAAKLTNKRVGVSSMRGVPARP